MRRSGALLRQPRHLGLICGISKVNSLLTYNVDEIVSQLSNFYTIAMGLQTRVIMNAPTQTTASAASSKKRGNILAVIVIILALGIIGGVISTAGNAPSCPDELIGSWTTTAPGYEDKVLLITKNGLAFNTGEGAEGQAVRQLEAIPDGPRTLYTIVYGTSRSDEQVLSFHYHTREQTLTFKNQKHLVWTRNTVES